MGRPSEQGASQKTCHFDSNSQGFRGIRPADKLFILLRKGYVILPLQFFPSVPVSFFIGLIMMRFLGILLLSVLCPVCMAQGVAGGGTFLLGGRVTGSDGLPLVSVTVAVDGSRAGTYTDADGCYSFRLPEGRYELVVSYVGYETEKAVVDLYSDARKDFVMHTDNVMLRSVEVYGKSKSQKLREGAFAVNALDVKDVAASVRDLASVVSKTTGIRIREEGGVGSDFELSINGMSGNSVRYFIDGVPMDSKGSGVNLANLPVNLIDRVEIYKGVVPVSLGADALGGAINIITNKKRKDYLDLSYGIGSFHTHKVDLNAQYVEKRSGLVFRPVFSLNYSRNDYMMKGVEVWNPEAGRYENVDRRRFHDGYFALLGQFEVGVSGKSWADAFFVSGSYSKVDKELQTGSTQSKVYGMAERLTDSWNVSAEYRKDDFLADGLNLDLSLSHTWDYSLTVDTAFRKYDWNGDYIESSRNEITGRDRSLRHYDRPLTIARTNVNYRFNDRHELNFNYMLNRTGNNRYDETDTEFVASKDVLSKQILGLSYSQSFFGGRMSNVFFVKDYVNHLKIGQQDLSWITGSDEVPSSSVKNNIGYGAGMRHLFVESFALKASYEHSVRLPLARELLGNGTTVYPNMKLRPESSDNWNIGGYGTARFGKGHMLFYEAGFFYRNVKDYIHAVVSEAEGMMQYDNVSDVSIKGVEGELRYSWRNILHVLVNCSYQDARDRQRYKSDGKPSVTYDNRVPNRPWLFGNAEAGLKFDDVFVEGSRLRLDYAYRYVHWFFLTWEGYGVLESKSKIPTQNMHDVTLSYSWDEERYNISLECRNIMDAVSYDNYMLQKPGRSFFCKFRLFIN